MANKASEKLKSIADMILGEDPAKKAASGTERAIGLGERAASRTQSSMESSIRGMERVGRQMESDTSAADRERKITNDMATWMAAIQSAGVPADTGTPQLDYYQGEDVDAKYDANVAQVGSYVQSREATENHKTDSAERVYAEGTPQFIMEGSAFRKALKYKEAKSYDTLFGDAERRDTPFKGVKITDMTLGEVLDFASFDGEWHSYNKDTHDKNTTALGKYQFVGATLRDLNKRGVLEKLGITEDTKFDKDTQDTIAIYLAKNRVDGKSKVAAREGLRNEWQGFRKLSDSQLDDIIAEIRKG